MSSLGRVLRASSSKRFLLLQSSFSISASSFSTRTTSTRKAAAATVSKRSQQQHKSAPPLPSSPSDWPRPKEIPFQAKVANSVNLIGYVSEPLQFQALPDHKYCAATVITQHLPSFSDSTQFRIPVIFEGDLAHAASCHLKTNDHVYISGQLCADPLPSDVAQGQPQLHIVVQNINFVQGSPKIKKSHKLEDEEDFLPELQKEEEPIVDFVVKDDTYVKQLWKDLFMSPHEWWDIRSQVDNAKGKAFERKNNGEIICIDDTTPKWLQKTLEDMTFDKKTTAKVGKSKDGDSALNSWRSLLYNPKEWWDYRSSKLNGSVNPKHPDFKHKDGGLALWLNTAPRWILPELDNVEFDSQIRKLKQPKQHFPESKKTKQHKGDEYWRDLADNPKKWWDNRLDKRNAKAPDFKHKETGVGLWLSNSPAWVLPQLPPLKSDKNVAISKKSTMAS